MEDMGTGAGLGALGFWLFIATVIAVGVWSSIRKRESQHETIRRAIESGQDIDPELADKLLTLTRTESKELDRDLKVSGWIVLFLSPGTSQLLRGQGTYLSDDEITAVVDFVATDSPQFAKELIELKTKDQLEAAELGVLKNRDEMYEAAVDVVVRERRGSVSLLQRCLGIGYGRAARLIDFMAGT